MNPYHCEEIEVHKCSSCKGTGIERSFNFSDFVALVFTAMFFSFAYYGFNQFLIDARIVDDHDWLSRLFLKKFLEYKNLY